MVATSKTQLLMELRALLREETPDAAARKTPAAKEKPAARAPAGKSTAPPTEEGAGGETAASSDKPLASATPKIPVLDAVVLGICREDCTRERAEEALRRFKSEFFDMNELRVSRLAEIESILAQSGVPNALERATRLRRFLKQLFNHVVSHNERTPLESVLDALAKKPQKEAFKALEGFEAMKSDYLQATISNLALGGHAIPLDGDAHRALVALGLIDPTTDAATARGWLERAIPKSEGREFQATLETLAELWRSGKTAELESLKRRAHERAGVPYEPPETAAAQPAPKGPSRRAKSVAPAPAGTDLETDRSSSASKALRKTRPARASETPEASAAPTGPTRARRKETAAVAASPDPSPASESSPRAKAATKGVESDSFSTGAAEGRRKAVPKSRSKSNAEAAPAFAETSAPLNGTPKDAAKSGGKRSASTRDKGAEPASEPKPAPSPASTRGERAKSKAAGLKGEAAETPAATRNASRSRRKSS